ncbi:TIGR00366 family protein [Pseudarthrobacter cellobiosi]|uniref:TIGR00366 family protein n=1 Tax=Pseudarthrobacter cellobiosi TaxID=2953654 RepID=UPI00208E64B9|nr:TIGR00366 family protein [Pseudarthrobacter sp. HLT1-5]MCO4256316.1 TIGR00366 family protein [Pseudarthrobacter sp. HLT1-5]
MPCRHSYKTSLVLPALALSKLKLKDIMGYTVIMMFWVGIIYIAAILLWGYLG